MRYLCRSISQVEWSGILLYVVEGSITDGSLVLIPKDIIPMHKGSTTYTEYSFNEKKRDQSGYNDRHIDYCEQYPEALGWKIGHIHSHNNMAVYFSSTDTAELNENAPSHNIYFSLIVNNRMEMVARVAQYRSVNQEVELDYSTHDESGNVYHLPPETKTVKHSYVIYHECDIEVEEVREDYDEFFIKSVMEIIAKASQASKRTYPTSTHYPKNTQTRAWSAYDDDFDAWGNTWKEEKEEAEDDPGDYNVEPNEVHELLSLVFTDQSTHILSMEELTEYLDGQQVTSQEVAKVFPHTFMEKFSHLYGDNYDTELFDAICHACLEEMSSTGREYFEELYTEIETSLISLKGK